MKQYILGDDQDIFPTVLPMFHIFGMNCVTFSRLADGAKLVTLPKFTPESYISTLEKNKVLFYNLHGYS